MDRDFEFGEDGEELGLEMGEERGVGEEDGGAGAEFGVGEGYNDGIEDVAVYAEGFFDLFGLDVFAARDEEVVFAAEDLEAVVVPRA